MKDKTTNNGLTVLELRDKGHPLKEKIWKVNRHPEDKETDSG